MLPSAQISCATGSYTTDHSSKGVNFRMLDPEPSDDRDRSPVSGNRADSSAAVWERSGKLKKITQNSSYGTVLDNNGSERMTKKKMNSITVANFVPAAVRECGKMLAYNFDKAYSAVGFWAAFKLGNDLNCCPCAASQLCSSPCAAPSSTAVS